MAKSAMQTWAKDRSSSSGSGKAITKDKLIEILGGQAAIHVYKNIGNKAGTERKVQGRERPSPIKSGFIERVRREKAAADSAARDEWERDEAGRFSSK